MKEGISFELFVGLNCGDGFVCFCFLTYNLQVDKAINRHRFFKKNNKRLIAFV